MLALSLLAQLAIVTQSPDTASTCSPIRLTAAMRVPGRVAPVLSAPAGAGFQLLRSAVVSRIEPDGAGDFSTITEATVDLATTATGRVAIPPFVAVLDGRRIVSRASVVEVQPSVAPRPIVRVRAWIDGGIGGAADSLIVGQQVDYVVDVLLNEPARNRLRRNPTFFPPEMASVLAYDLPLPSGVPRRGRGCFETLSYRRALFPLYPGTVVIPPAVLTYSLPLTSSFFSREESFEARTDSVRITALEPPLRGRPDDYAGAVGALRIATRVPPGSARVGDPMVLTVRVEGTGNVKLLPRPSLALDWASLALDAERVKIDTSASRIRGSKEFDWIVTPRRDGEQLVPPVRYPVYDASERRYAILRSEPLSLTIMPGSLASADTIAAPRLPIRVVMREQRSAPLSTRPLFWMALALAPLPAAIGRALRRDRTRSTRLTAGRRLQTLARGADPLPARELRRLFLDALRERVPAVGRDMEPLARVLRRAGVGDTTALEAEALLATLDDAAFSPAGRVDLRALRESAEISRAVEREAVSSRQGGVASVLVVCAALATAGAAALAVAPGDAQRSFAEGVRAYERAQFSIAQRRFQLVVQEQPRAADAWANLGTSAWQARDSVEASRAWHRSLRLDPLDWESRERLAGVQALGIRSPAYVAPLSSDHVALIVLVFWIGAWVALAVPHRRRPAATRPVAGGAIVLAVAGVLLLLELRDRALATDLAVLAHGRALASAPSADAPSAAAARAGEAGRVGARDAGWVHITLDEARQGWVPGSAVVPLTSAAAAPD